MLGGDLHWIWTGYEIYQEIDHVCLFYFVRSALPGRQVRH